MNRRGEKGQVAILFALVFTFMFILFGFVVDFGQLVTNKINLQIAADNAAYAGAAWQARILNHIGVLNYRLRQDLKEFAMRVNVTHLRHNDGFPSGSRFIRGGDAFSQDLELFICQQAHGYRSLSNTFYSLDTNLCKYASPRAGGLPPIVVPPVIARFDPFAFAIQAQIRRIQQEANKQCRAAAVDNEILVRHLINVYSSRAQFHLRQITELEGFLNAIGSQSPATSDHPLLKTAYQTAIRNLTISNAEQGQFNFEVLQPNGGQYLRLNPYLLQAALFFFNFEVVGDGCVGKPRFLNFNNLVAGVNKDQNILTYFAVKLTSKPKMLFMPAPWIGSNFPELTAIAVAKPFGGRIGPMSTVDRLLPVSDRPGTNNPVLNFSFRPDDSLGIRNTKILAYFDALHNYNSIGRPDGNQASGWPDAGKRSNDKDAMRAIRAPTIFDALFYNIFPDPGPNKNTDYPYEPEYAELYYPDYLEVANHESFSLIDLPQPRTRPYFPAGVGSRNRGSQWIQINANNSGANDGYQGYAEEAIASHSLTSIIGLPLMNGNNKAEEFGFATPEMIHSAWAPRGKAPRIGYSVKFIGMEGLRNTIIRRDDGGEGPISNPPTGDINLDRIIH